MVHRLDVGKRRLREKVSRAAEATPRLPLIHGTDVYALEDILDAGSLDPQPCPVFTGESLTYLFYGRPSFRPNASADPSALGHYYPVCLIFKATSDPDLRRIFPFDSGAFQNEYYARFLHKHMKLGDFALEPDLSSPARLVELFFGSVPAYLLGRPVAEPTLDPSDFEAQSYAALINAKEGNDIDSRGSGIELQTADALNISDAVDAVILPSSFAAGATGAKLAALGIERIPYRTYDRMRPSEYTTAIHDLCLAYYVKRRILLERDI